MDQTGAGVAADAGSGVGPPEVEAALSDASRALLAMIDRARQQALELLLAAEQDAAAIRAAAGAEGERHLDGVTQVIEDARRRIEAELRSVEADAPTLEHRLVQPTE
jgi:hypothetical protein